ncbi:MAG: Type 4 prepilin-like protein leader peptide processing enzyme [Candidatus Uhrbacteria bacterium GW2011_GWA2_52_8d]|uniref:Type 4 prepilin-like protein leader peptide processing enzyme n=1 Tax=Candidatus Uhrbacteria bacterium GW2011_GWA2_52_8d TaxID=1618979 RepID=A0A0G1XQ46_9BACT|nr:MAG: Type 4 prepilin-like protein leader peptide processing enzyme [Candidatus Uhrbacteria bacterium GW2011_GWA2_52_8d]
MAIFRTHEGESVVTGRSKCRACEVPIGAQDLVPVLSYLRLRGRCRSCKSVISWQYPAVEIVTGFLFVVAFLSSTQTLNDSITQSLLFLRNGVFLSYLVLIFVYDLRHMLIIDRFTIPAMIFAIIINLWLGTVPAWSVLVGGLVLAGFFWIQFLLSKGTWVGGGDIRMGALMGFMLGLEHGLVALFIAYVLGAIVGLMMMVTGRATRKTPVPFGTFLSVSTVLVLFAGKQILDWYLSFFA